ALIGALAVIRLEVETRQEDVANLAAAAGQLHTRLLQLIEELAALNVDKHTIGNVHAVADAVTGQSHAASNYVSMTDAAAAQADIASRTAVRHHGAIEEAVNAAPVRMAKPAFYGE